MCDPGQSSSSVTSHSSYNFNRYPNQVRTMRKTQGLLASSIVCITLQQQVVALSTSSCAALGWDANTYGSTSVCGGSDLKNTVPICDPASTWSDANAMCTGAGARLCTYEELGNQETRAAGCGVDGNLLWSSTPCVGGGYYLEYGAANFQVPGEACAADSQAQLFRFRCCADVFDTPSPTIHPTTPLPTSVVIAATPTQTPTTPQPTATTVSAVPTVTPTTIQPTVTSVVAVPIPAPTTLLPTTTPIASPTVGEVDAVVTPEEDPAFYWPETLAPTPTVTKEYREAIWSYRTRTFRQFCSRNAGSISYIAVGTVLAVGGSLAVHRMKKTKKSEADADVPTNQVAQGGDVELAEQDRNEA